MRSRIRLAIFGGLLLLQALSVTTLVIVSGRQITESETEFTNALLEAAVADTAQEVARLIAPAENVVAVSARVAAQGELESTAQASILLATMSELPQLAGLFVGWENGGFVYVTREGSGFRVKIITVEDGVRSVSILLLGPEGELASATIDPDDTYDPRVRPWYDAAMDRPDETVWTDPYVFFTSGELGITTARAITTEGSNVGVVGADIELISLSEHLGAHQLTDSVHSLIFNDEGTIIAHPDPSSTRRLGPDGFEPVKIDQLAKADERAAAAVIPSVADGVVGYVDTQGRPSRIATDSLPIGSGEWRLAVFGQRADLEAALTPSDGQRRQLVIVVAILSVILFVVFAIPATQPIRVLNELADTDTLTGLPNRRAVLRAAGQAADVGEQRAIAMVDLDRFKAINDTYGHAVGDIVLAEAAERLVNCLRGDATVGRIGGEEFLVTFSAGSADHVARVGERIRDAIDRRPIETGRGQVDLTTSVGMAMVSGSYSATDLFAAADDALLEAKEQGRNRVVIRDLGDHRDVSLVTSGTQR